jgi:hypothetical protein
VLGAAGLFDDAWLDKEDNSRLSDFVFKWLRPVSTEAQQLAPHRQPPAHMMMPASSWGAATYHMCDKQPTLAVVSYAEPVLDPRAFSCLHVPALYV